MEGARSVKIGFSILIPLLLVSCLQCTTPWSGKSARGITILTYNLENLFNAIPEGGEYTEYDPRQGKWTEDLYELRLANTADVIRAACPGGPEIVLLQELENGEVARDLLERNLVNFGYTLCAAPKAPGTAVTIAVLSRLPVGAVRVHSLVLPKSNPGRSVLEVEIILRDCTLFLFNNHWKSKSGGARETECRRIEEASLVRGRLEEILSFNPGAEIIVAGDLNESALEYLLISSEYPTALMPLSPSSSVSYTYPEGSDKENLVCRNCLGETEPWRGLFVSQSPRLDETEASGVVLFDPWSLLPTGEGSYWFNGRWERIDNFLLSKGVMDEAGISFLDIKVVKPKFLLDEQGIPKSWNTNLKEGYSDHLPLLLTLELN